MLGCPKAWQRCGDLGRGAPSFTKRRWPTVQAHASGIERWLVAKQPETPLGANTGVRPRVPLLAWAAATPRRRLSKLRLGYAQPVTAFGSSMTKPGHAAFHFSRPCYTSALVVVSMPTATRIRGSFCGGTLSFCVNPMCIVCL